MEREIAMRTCSFVAPLVLGTLLVASAASAAGFTEFDAPGAGTGLGQGTFAYRINFSSEISGYYIDSNNNTHGFLRAMDGSFKTFDAKRAATWSIAINDRGTLGGTYDVLLKNRDSSDGFVRAAGGKIETINPRGNRWGASVLGINRAGEIIGHFVDGNDVLHGFFRTKNGKLTQFDAPNATGTDASGINDNGVIVGLYRDAQYDEHGYVRAADGSFTEFDPQGSQDTLATAVNSKGWIDGHYSGSDGVLHGYLRDPRGKFTVYDAPDAGKSKYQGTGGGEINSQIAVTGAWYDSSNAEHGYVRLKNGTLTEFDAPDAAGLTSPQGINDSGVISGYYQDSAGAYHGFLRTP